jgi:ATP-binding cassette subfamily B protein
MQRELAGFIWYFLKNHKGYIVGLTILCLVASIEISIDPYLIKYIIDTTNQYTHDLKNLPSAILVPASLYVLITIMHNLHMRYWGYLCINLFPQLRIEITTALFKHLSQHSLAFFQQHFSGELANKIMVVSEGTENIIKLFSEMVLARIFIILIAGSLLATVHWYFTVVLLIWVLLYIGNGYRLANQTTEYAADFSQATSALSGQVVDSVANIMSAKIFSNVGYEERRLQGVTEQLSQKDILLQSHINKTHFFQGLLYTALVIALLIGLVYGRMHAWVTLGDFAFVLSLFISVATLINGLTQSMPSFAKEIGKCQQALNTIITAHSIVDAVDAKPIHVVKATIRFQEVNFGYGHSLLFKNLNLYIPAAQKVGLVGYSGGGKTSFINLILRLYDVNAGAILIADQDIKSVTQKSLIDNIALIPQQPELFNRSIMDNIRYGNVTASDEEVYKAAELAHCHEFVEPLPLQYQAIVGERGVKLSGGQRQRIIIARAILKNAPIIILDEATSALDSFTEQQIQRSFATLMEKKTVIAIAHRLSTLSQMDRILFFDQGKMVEDGTFEGLKARSGGYFNRLLE